MRLPRATVEMNREHRHVRRRDPADAQGLSEAAGREGRQLLAGLVAQAAYRRVVDARRDQLLLELREPLDLPVLAGDVALVFDADFGLTSDVGGDVREIRCERDEGRPVSVGPAQI